MFLHSVRQRALPNPPHAHAFRRPACLFACESVCLSACLLQRRSLRVGRVCDRIDSKEMPQKSTLHKVREGGVKKRARIKAVRHAVALPEALGEWRRPELALERRTERRAQMRARRSGQGEGEERGGDETVDWRMGRRIMRAAREQMAELVEEEQPAGAGPLERRRRRRQQPRSKQTDASSDEDEDEDGRWADQVQAEWQESQWEALRVTDEEEAALTAFDTEGRRPGGNVHFADEVLALVQGRDAKRVAAGLPSPVADAVRVDARIVRAESVQADPVVAQLGGGDGDDAAGAVVGAGRVRGHAHFRLQLERVGGRALLSAGVVAALSRGYRCASQAQFSPVSGAAQGDLQAGGVLQGAGAAAGRRRVHAAGGGAVQLGAATRQHSGAAFRGGTAVAGAPAVLGTHLGVHSHAAGQEVRAAVQSDRRAGGAFRGGAGRSARLSGAVASEPAGVRAALPHRAHPRTERGAEAVDARQTSPPDHAGNTARTLQQPLPR
eukprot:ctg_1989.g352